MVIFFRKAASSLSKKFIKRNDTSRLENSARTRKTVIEPLERREMLSAAPDYGILCTVITYDEYLARTALTATEQTTPTFSYAKNMSFKEMLDSLEKLEIETADSDPSGSNASLLPADLETKFINGVECCSLRQLEALRVVFESSGLSDEDDLFLSEDEIISLSGPDRPASGGGTEPIYYPISVSTDDDDFHTHAANVSGITYPLLERFDYAGFSVGSDDSDYATITLPALPASYYSMVSLSGTASYGVDYELYFSVNAQGVQGVSVSNNSFYYAESGGSTNFYLVPINDGLLESDETATLTMGDIVPPVSGGGDYIFDYGCRSATAAIIDDDHWQVSIAETDDLYLPLNVAYDENGNEIHTTLSETGRDMAFFHLTRNDDGSCRSGDFSYPVSVCLSFTGQADSSDFKLFYYDSMNVRTEAQLGANSFGTWVCDLTIPASSSSTDLYIETINDSCVERHVESLIVSVSSAESLGSGPLYGFLSVGATSSLVDILDNDHFVLNSVSFTNNLDLLSDMNGTGTAAFGAHWGNATHWTRNNPSATLPVAYACDDYLACQASVAGLKDESEFFQIQAVWGGCESGWVPLTNGAAFVAFADTLLSQLGGRQALYDEDFTLTWKFRAFGEVEERTFGESVNPLYVTYKTPVSGAHLYHTVVHIGCAVTSGIVPENLVDLEDPENPENPETTQGETEEETEEERLAREEKMIFDAIWSEFTLLSIHKVKMENGAVVEENDLLTYYGKDVEVSAHNSQIKLGLSYTYDNGDITYDQSPSRAREFAQNTPNPNDPMAECFNTSGLLKHSDGTCGAWMKFALDVFRSQGMTVQGYGIRLTPQGASDIYKFKVSPTLPGQGFMRPRENTWGDHAVFTYQNKVYDPSYGTVYGAYGTEALGNFIGVLDSIGKRQSTTLSNGYGYKYTPTKNASQIQVSDVYFQ